MLQPKLLQVSPMQENRLRLLYETGEQKIFDVTPYLSGRWFSALHDYAYFCTVRLLPGGGGIEWRDGQDIAPHELYENSIPVS